MVMIMALTISKDAIIREIRALLDRHGDGRKPMSGRELSKRAGLSENAVGMILKGEVRSPRMDTLTSIFASVGEGLPTTLIGSGGVAGETEEDLEVVGTVEAGVFRQRDELIDETYTVAFPRDRRFPHAQQYAYRVRGDSMDRLGILDGGYIRVINFEDSGLSLKPDMIVVVQRTVGDGALVELTCKQVEHNGRAWRLCPRSNNPRHKVIEMAYEDDSTVEVIGVVTAAFTADFAI